MTEIQFKNRQPMDLEQADWQALIDAHPMESNNPEEWRIYGIALLQLLQHGPDLDKQRHQAALAFVQAQKEGMNEQQIAEAQRLSTLLSLVEMIKLAGMAHSGGLVKQQFFED